MASASAIRLWSINGSRFRRVSKRCHTATFAARVELIKTTGFNGFHEFGQVIVEFVQGHIQPAALGALRCCWIPEFHTHLFYSNLCSIERPFSQQNKENHTPDAATQPPNPTPKLLPQHSPDPLT